MLFYIVPSNIKGIGSDQDDENETSSKRKKKRPKSRRKKRLNKVSLMKSKEKINDLNKSSVFFVFYC